MTYLQIVATIQDFDPKTKSTRFDEPVGIAFAGNKKAYVALSSENEVAVIDVPSRSISKRLKIPAQDPRAIVVRNERLYVCLLYTSPSPRDRGCTRMPSSA